MDPLSVTSGVAGIITLAGSAYQAIATYVGHVKNAATEIQNLATEIRNLYGILSNLSLLASSLEKDHLPATLKHSHLNACHKTLYKIDLRVSMAVGDFRTGSRLDMIKRRLRWPFSVGETQELLEEMTRHKDNISLALSADSMARLMEVLSMQKEIESSMDAISGAVEELQEAMETRIEIEVRTAIDKKRQEIVSFFQAINPQSKFETSMDLRQDMTGLWLTEGTKFRQWKTQPNARIWLSGIPGSGKTVLCGAVVQDILQLSSPTTAVAFFFCDYAVPESQLPVQVVGSLAVQLALQKPEAFNILEEYYQGLHPSTGLAKPPRLGRLVDLVRELAASSFDQVFVVIDALDECGKSTVDVVAALKDIADRCCNISMALFSRDEEHIRRILEDDFSNIEIAANRDDLSLYLATQMARRHKFSSMLVRQPDLYNDIRQSLLEGAQGMFRWVACQLDYLESLPSNRQRKKALTKLPPSLFQTYQRILDAAFAEESNDETRELIQRTLHWIAVSSPPLTIPQLCEAVSLHEDENDLDEDDVVDELEIAQACSSLIRKTHNGNGFEFAHFTVREFLETLPQSSHLAPFRLDPESAIQSLAIVSLRYLLLDKFGCLRPPSDISDFAEGNGTCPFYQHAMSRWAFYAQKHFENPTVLALATQLFGPAKSSQFCNFISSLVSYVLGPYTASTIKALDINASDTSTLHLAAALGLSDVCAYLLNNNSDAHMQSQQLGFPLDASLSGIWGLSLKTSLPFRTIDGSKRTETVDLLLARGASCTLVWRKIKRLELYSPLYDFQNLGDANLCAKVLNHTIYDGGFIVDFSAALLEKSKTEPFFRRLVYSIYFLAEGDCAVTGQLGQLIKMIRKRHNSHPFEYRQDNKTNLPSLTVQQSPEALVEAMMKNDIKSLQHLLSFQPHWCHDLRLGGETILHLAVENECLNSMKVLLANGFPINSTNKAGQTALLRCFLNSRAHMLKLLLSEGANITAEDENGNTLWHLAASMGSTSILDILLHWDDVDAALRKRDRGGRTPIIAAERLHKSDAAEFLVESSECLPEYFLGTNRHAVLPVGSTILVMLEAKNMLASCLPNEGPSPLHTAGLSCHSASVKQLLPYVDVERRFEGRSAIEFAILDFWQMTRRHIINVDSLVSTDTFVALITPNLVRENGFGGKLLWEQLCLCPAGIYGEVQDLYAYNKISALYRLLVCAVDAGAADAFEDQNPGVSAVVPLLPVFYLLEEGGKYGGGQKTQHWLYDEPIEEERAAKALWHILRRSKDATSTLHLHPKLQHTFDAIFSAVINGKLPPLDLLTDYVFGTRLATASDEGAARSLTYLLQTELPNSLFNMLMKKVHMHDLVACDKAVLADIFHTLTVNDDDRVYRYHGLLHLTEDEDRYLYPSALPAKRVKWPVVNDDDFDWKQTFTMKYAFMKPRTFSGCNVMHAAALLGWTFLLDFCLQNQLFDIDTTSDGDKLTPLICAAINRRASTARYLVSWGADTTRCSAQGWLPYSFAKEGDDLWEALESYKNHEIIEDISVAVQLAGLDKLANGEDELQNDRDQMSVSVTCPSQRV